MSSVDVTPKNLLVVGATGMLGSQVSLELVKNKAFSVKVLVRKESLEKKKDLIDLIKSHGGIIVEGDITDVDSLIKALEGVDTIISVVGFPQLMDQLNFIEAAKKVPSVKRIVPSEYGFDVSHLNSDSLLYAKSHVLNSIKESGLEYTSITNGSFYEFLASETFGFDHKNGVFVLPGTGDEVIVATHTSDIAKFVPEILLDPLSRNNIILIQGERTTLRKLTKIFEEASGKKFDVQYVSVEQLKKQQDEAEGFGKILAYLKSLIVSIGNPNLDQSGRYTVQPMSLKQYAKTIYQK